MEPCNSSGHGAPQPENEAERIAKLRSYGVLDTPPERTFDQITRLASRLFQVPAAMVSLVDERRQWFKSRVGLNYQEMRRSHSFCAHAILDNGVLVVPDSLLDLRFSANPHVLGDPGIRFYAGAPLCVDKDIRLGTLCVVDVVPRAFTESDERLLAGLADLVVEEMGARGSARDPLAENEGGSRQLIEQAGDPIFMCDLEGRLVDLNEEACTVLGYTRHELLLLKLENVEVTASAQKMLTSRQEHSSGGAELITGRLRRKDGTTFPIEARVSFPYRAGQQLMLAVARDMSRHEQVETFLRQAKTEAEQANDIKSEFLSLMSHEFMTPLNAVLGFGRLLLEQTDPNTQQDCARQVVRAGERLLQLINELLEASRLSNAAGELEIRPVAVAEIVRGVVDEIRAPAAKRNITIGVCADPFPPCLVLADRRLLRQILLRLLDNTVKFSSEASSIAFDYFPVGDQVRFCIRDPASVMPAERLARLFEPGGHSAQDTAGLGTAPISLILCKHLVEVLSGAIGAESTVGGGTTFWVQLAAAEHSEPSPAPLERAAAGRPGIVQTILYIDDDESNLKLIEYLIAPSEDMRLLTAATGVIGVEIALTHRPSLILLDLHLQDLNGEEVLARLRANSATRNIPVVAVSGDTSPAKIKRLEEAGVSSYLTKPLNLQQVQKLLLTILKGPPPWHSAAQAPRP